MYAADRDEFVANHEPMGEVFSGNVDVYPAMELFEVDDCFRGEGYDPHSVDSGF